jgi:cyclopropane fatty-acyl-phospholipid synthase-like methyltransferase
VDKPYSGACERNQAPILAVLRRRYAHTSHVLEIGSGTGQHAVHFAAALPQLVWQTSDRPQQLEGIRLWLAEAGLANTPPPWCLDVATHPLPTGSFDAVYTANTMHILAWREVERLFAALPGWMTEHALLTVYGPFRCAGRFASPGDAAFDAALRADRPERGLRDIEAVHALARGAGLSCIEDAPMPANNRCVTWQRLA